MSREDLEKQLERMNAGKTPEQIIQESFDHTRNLIELEKKKEEIEVSSRISGMRAIFNACNPRYKKNI